MGIATAIVTAGQSMKESIAITAATGTTDLDPTIENIVATGITMLTGIITIVATGSVFNSPAPAGFLSFTTLRC